MGKKSKRAARAAGAAARQPGFLELPTELLTNVLLRLSNGDLFSCLTLCKAMRKPIETHLYSNLTVRIHTTDSEYPETHWKKSWAGRFLTCIEKRDDGCGILRSIRNWDISLRTSATQDHQNWLQAEVKAADPSQALARRQITGIFPMMHPETLKLDFTWEYQIINAILTSIDTRRLRKLILGSPSWRRVPPSTGHLISHSSATLEHLEIHGREGFIAYSNSSRTVYPLLKTVSIQGVCFNHTNVIGQLLYEARALQNLSVHRCETKESTYGLEWLRHCSVSPDTRFQWSNMFGGRYSSLEVLDICSLDDPDLTKRGVLHERALERAGPDIYQEASALDLVSRLSGLRRLRVRRLRGEHLNRIPATVVHLSIGTFLNNLDVLSAQVGSKAFKDRLPNLETLCLETLVSGSKKYWSFREACRRNGFRLVVGNYESFMKGDYSTPATEDETMNELLAENDFFGNMDYFTSPGEA